MIKVILIVKVCGHRRKNVAKVVGATLSGGILLTEDITVLRVRDVLKGRAVEQLSYYDSNQKFCSLF